MHVPVLSLHGGHCTVSCVSVGRNHIRLLREWSQHCWVVYSSTTAFIAVPFTIAAAVPFSTLMCPPMPPFLLLLFNSISFFSSLSPLSHFLLSLPSLFAPLSLSCFPNCAVQAAA